MNRIFVDQSGFDYFRYLSVEPKMKYQNGRATEEQDTDDAGTPLFNIICLAKPTGASKPETISVKVPMSSAPTLEEFALVAFARLSAFAYASGDHAQLSFSADKVGKIKE